MSMQLSATIEAILFYYAEPVSLDRLVSLLNVSHDDVNTALNELEMRLLAGGTRLVRSGTEVTLGTAPEASALIEAITKEELSKDLSKSAIETLSIVLYKGPLTRAEIDYIRGVNSTFILRNLQVRGLIERVDNPSDQRSFLYRPTFRLLESLGLSKIEDLPNYEETQTILATFAGGVSAKQTENSGVDDVDGNESPDISQNTRSDDPTIDEGIEGDDAWVEEKTQERGEDLATDVEEENYAAPAYDDTALRSHHSETNFPVTPDLENTDTAMSDAPPQ